MTVENYFSFLKYNQFTGELTFLIKLKFINNFKLYINVNLYGQNN